MIVPVFSVTHLDREIKKLEQFSSVIRSLIFLNCGGMLDLTETWFYSQQNCNAYLIDYHRPFHHNNMIDTYRKIFIIDDGCKSFVECPSEDDVRIFQELQGQSDSDNESNDDDLNSEEESEKSSEQEEVNDANEEIKQELNDLKDDTEEMYGNIN